MSTYNRYFNGGVSKEQLNKVISECRATPFPLEDVLDENLINWYRAVSWSRNTKPEFVFLSSIGVVSSLLGCNTKLLIRQGSKKEIRNARKSYTEPPQLYLTMLSEPGSGKSNAQNLAVDEPLMDQQNEKLNSLILQEYTRKGLFDHLQHHNGMGLISLSEIQSFYEQLVKRQGEGAAERQLFNKLHDGSAPWLKSSAARSKNDEQERRECVSSNCLSICGFAQPQPFIDLYKEMAKFNDGFIDRILICSIKPMLLKEHELSFWDNELDKYDIQGFHSIYDNIYNIHQSGMREYKFDADALNAYNKISDEAVERLMEKWNGNNISFDCSSKDKRNLSRIALSLHVLKTSLRKVLNTKGENVLILEDDIPIEIDIETLAASKTVIDYMVKQREALHWALVNDITEKKKRTAEDEFTPSEEFPEIFTSWIENVCSKINTSPFLILRNDGIVLRVEDSPDDIPFTKERLQKELNVYGRMMNPSLNFAGKKNRGLWIEWKKVNAYKDRLHTAIKGNIDKHKVSKSKTTCNSKESKNSIQKERASSINFATSNEYEKDGLSDSCSDDIAGCSGNDKLFESTLEDLQREIEDQTLFEVDNPACSGNDNSENKKEDHKVLMKRKIQYLYDSLSKNEVIDGKRRK